MTMKIIIAGGRDYGHFLLADGTRDQAKNDRAARVMFHVVDMVISQVDTKIEIVSGMARGADEMGGVYARARGYTVREFHANWDEHRKAAGPIRNRKMGMYSDVLVAFWDGKSKGTRNMIDIALTTFGLEVHVYRYTNTSLSASDA